MTDKGFWKTLNGMAKCPVRLETWPDFMPLLKQAYDDNLRLWVSCDLKPETQRFAKFRHLELTCGTLMMCYSSEEHAKHEIRGGEYALVKVRKIIDYMFDSPSIMGLALNPSDEDMVMVVKYMLYDYMNGLEQWFTYPRTVIVPPGGIKPRFEVDQSDWDKQKAWRAARDEYNKKHMPKDWNLAGKHVMPDSLVRVMTQFEKTRKAHLQLWIEQNEKAYDERMIAEQKRKEMEALLPEEERLRLEEERRLEAERKQQKKLKEREERAKVQGALLLPWYG